MLATLKEETKRYHSDVEKVLIQELKGLVSLKDYAILLSKLHDFYEPVEKKLGEIIDTNMFPDIERRRHVYRLKADLDELEYTALLKKENSFPNVISTVSYALGVMYVIEGSTLGGQIISEMLKKQLPFEGLDVTTYFSSYGNETNTMWSGFKKHVEANKGYIDFNLMTLGAKDTFVVLKAWLLSYDSFGK